MAYLGAKRALRVGPGLEVEGTRMLVEGGGVPGHCHRHPRVRTEIVMLRPPGGSTRLELSSFVRPDHEPGSLPRWPTSWGLRNVGFEVDDLWAAVDGQAADDTGLVGGIGQQEHIWRMAYTCGLEGTLVSLAQRPEA